MGKIIQLTEHPDVPGSAIKGKVRDMRLAQRRYFLNSHKSDPAIKRAMLNESKRLEVEVDNLTAHFFQTIERL